MFMNNTVNPSRLSDRSLQWATHFTGCLLVFALCQAAAASETTVFQTDKLAEIDQAIRQTIATNNTPGAVFWLEHEGVAYHRAYGRRAIVPQSEPATEDTIYDVASLTKVMATTPSIMLLLERGLLKLDAPVEQYIPEFTGSGKQAITIRHLLTHTSGLRPGLGGGPPWSGREHAIKLACAETPLQPPGKGFRYSDINFIVLGEVVQRVSGEKLEDFVAREIYAPLGMKDTGYLPPAAKRSRIAPTERSGNTMLRGTVHDPTSRRMGGVAGHAGVFTTIDDLARYARMMLNLGTLDGVRLFNPETVRLMTSVQTPDSIEARRGLGWDIDSGYSRPRGTIFPRGSYGHTGWTGTCLWIDPFSRTFWIMLSNRVHPDGQGNVLPLEGNLGTLAAQAVVGFNFTYVPGALAPRPEPSAPPTGAATNRVTSPSRRISTQERPMPVPSTVDQEPLENAAVLNGIDVLVNQDFRPLKGLRIGLITNQAGTDRRRKSTIELLRHAPEVTLSVLFSPEHGIQGNREEKIADATDSQSGLRIYSLYGESTRPTPEQLKDLDALVYDLQDVGCRFYTYLSTLGYCLEAAAKAHLKFFVLDRVNPINGLTLDGPVLTSPTSFIAYHTIPVRHGMTVGELARMYNQENGFEADLTVIPLEGWTRGLWLDQTGLPWINPSPNMRNLNEAMLYPGVGLLETTALSVGRGTGTPFEIVGAPYIDDVQLAGELNHAGLPGVRFVPVRFTPNASVYKDQPCGGVSILLTDRRRCEVVDIGILVAQTLHRLYPQDFDLEKFNALLGNQATIDAIKEGRSLTEIRQLWAADMDKFRQRRAAFLLYH
jgi:uncharacterized protein YbbC (DUF1343 family)/CubicO group peptidase (beta-lactamase class C family)